MLVVHFCKKHLRLWLCSSSALSLTVCHPLEDQHTVCSSFFSWRSCSFSKESDTLVCHHSFCFVSSADVTSRNRWDCLHGFGPDGGIAVIFGEPKRWRKSAELQLLTRWTASWGEQVMECVLVWASDPVACWTVLESLLAAPSLKSNQIKSLQDLTELQHPVVRKIQEWVIAVTTLCLQLFIKL